ncbi:hypothetical protein A3A38_04825 [Candidatus Kaiserbacteria bacterium RIFCSPLOWO2_01_FULL_53_17]|uniref:EfeO-type cupredoxin-like domain-containing protein n=1 Tax=Candidatus Kaiserbacteria bacterium RIFCSPLOWO2_01_FULL_53_17 TaxID=1798511 RepID=A0A1F6EHI1_9BACT|nr:MAG: hypothetical protein A3A38_04825 [Candidatus Kaiserbacteria bacterium RIFCSPLOWO2_01_FULL_53_17]
MKNFLIALVLVVILGGGYYWYAQQSAPAETSSAPPDFGMTADESNRDAMDAPPAANTSAGSSGANVNVNVGATVTTGTVKELTVSNAGLTFNPKTLLVKKGDRVKITFKNTGGTHDLRVDGYGVGTKVIQAGQEESFEFIADKAGTFEYYCSVGEHRQMGMKGTLTVQ